MTADASKLVDFLRREAAEEYMPAQKDMYLQAAPPSKRRGWMRRGIGGRKRTAGPKLARLDIG